MSTRSLARPAGSTLLAAIGGFAGQIASAYAQRRAARQLATLDDHMLADIGVSRGEIERAVRGR